MTQEYTPDTEEEDSKQLRSNEMKYTTLPTKPGRYIDRVGDDWELTEDLKWYCNGNSYPSSRLVAMYWLPFTDAPKDDEPTPPEDNVQRIENIKDIKAGDRVFFHDDPNGYKLIKVGDRNCLYVSLCESNAPSWLRDALSNDVLVNKSFFDHAERPKQSWPKPEGMKLRMYLGANGERYIYVPLDEINDVSWIYVKDGHYAWSDAATLAKKYPEALPLREFTTPEEQA